MARSGNPRFLENPLQGDRPSVRLAIPFKEIDRHHEKRNRVAGCIFCNTAFEMSERNETYRAVNHGVSEEWRRAEAWPSA